MERIGCIMYVSISTAAYTAPDQIATNYSEFRRECKAQIPHRLKLKLTAIRSINCCSSPFNLFWSVMNNQYYTQMVVILSRHSRQTVCFFLHIIFVVMMTEIYLRTKLNFSQKYITLLNQQFENLITCDNSNDI